MSQAEELLNSLSVEEATTYSVNPDTEEHIVIGKDRCIKVPESLRRIAVQFDHNIETVTFDCPRFWDNHDMSAMAVYIVCKRPDGEKIPVIAENVRIDSTDREIIHFDWTIKSDVTYIKGNLVFLVCVKKTNDEGIISNHWNTELCKDLYISEGMEIDIELPEETTSDILTQLLELTANIETSANEQIALIESSTQSQIDLAKEEVKAETDLQKSNVEAKGIEVLSTIPEDYQTTYNMADEALRRKANAIAVDTYGEGNIFIHDASENKFLSMNVYGRTYQDRTEGFQLFDANTNEIITTGPTYVVENDLIRYLSEETYMPMRLRLNHNLLMPGHTYVLECDSISDGLICQILGTNQATYETILNVSLSGTRTEFTVPSDADMSIFETFDKDAAYLALSFYVKDTTYKNKNMFVKGLRLYDSSNTMTKWEMYTGGKPGPSIDYPIDLDSVKDPKVTVLGLNLAGGEAIADMIVNASKSGTATKDTDNKTVSYTGGGINLANIVEGIFKPNTQYTLILYGQNIDATDSYTNLSFLYDDGDLHDSLLTFGVHGINSYLIAVSEPGKTLKSIVGRWASGTVLLYYDKCGLFEGSISLDDFEEYRKEQVLTLNRELHGVPVAYGGNYTDSEGKQWLCDEIDLERGVYVQRTKLIELDGSDDEAWYYESDYGVQDTPFYLYDASGIVNIDGRVVMCDKYMQGESLPVENYRLWGKTTYFGETKIMFRNDDITNIIAWREFLASNPIKLLYTLNKPIEIQLEETEIQAYKSLKTNYHNTTILNNENAYIDIKYAADSLIYLSEHLPHPTDEQVNTSVDKYLESHGTQVPSDDRIRSLIYETLEVIADGTY